jgi:biotin carboxyl carrier protein
MNYKAKTNGGGETPIEIKSATEISVSGHAKEVSLVSVGGGMYELLYANKVYLVSAVKTDEGYEVKLDGKRFEVELKDEKKLLLEKFGIAKASGAKAGVVKSPMPGLVVRLEVKVGDAVSIGQGLLILESMKMENEVKSAFAGTVKEILVAEKQAVEKGQPLLRIE